MHTKFDSIYESNISDIQRYFFAKKANQFVKWKKKDCMALFLKLTWDEVLPNKLTAKEISLFKPK